MAEFGHEPADADVLAQLQQSHAVCPFPWCAGEHDGWELEGLGGPAAFTRWHSRSWPSSGVLLGQAEFAPGTDPAHVMEFGQPEVTGPDERVWVGLRLDGSLGPGPQDLDAVGQVAADLLAAVGLARASRVA